MTLCEQAHGDSGNEKLPFNKKKSVAEPGSERDSHLLQPVGGEGRKTRQKTRCGTESEINNNSPFTFTVKLMFILHGQ